MAGVVLQLRYITKEEEKFKYTETIILKPYTNLQGLSPCLHTFQTEQHRYNNKLSPVRLAQETEGCSIWARANNTKAVRKHHVR